MYITTIVHDSNNFAIGYSPLAKNLTYAYMINRHKLFAIFSGKTQLGSWIGDNRSYISVGVRISDRNIIRIDLNFDVNLNKLKILDVGYKFSYEQESENENLGHVLICNPRTPESTWRYAILW